MLDLLLLLALAASAASTDSLGRMEELVQKEMAERLARVDDIVEPLRELQPLYRDPDRHEEAFTERMALAEARKKDFLEFLALNDEFLRLQSMMHTQVPISLIRDRDRKAIGDAARLRNIDDAYKGLSDRFDRLSARMLEDQALYEAAAQAYDARLTRRKRIRWALGVCSGLIIFGLIAAGLARRTAARTVRRALTVEPKPDAQALAGNIRLDKVIGEGGMGLVYEGMDLTLDRKVAVKQMRAEISENPRGLSQFLAEARSVAALKHPNIVEIYSILKEQEKLYLVFEYVEGETLHHALQVNKKLTLEQAMSVLRQAASALDYAHSKKVIHRDLKPSNIMLTPAGVARLMDFGIAYQAKKTIAMLTKAEKWGTPAFMSPEQELGEIGKETDIYALGVCFYAMLTGTLPFPGPDFLSQKRALALSGAELLPPKLLPVMKKALAADPRERYHSGTELVSALC